MDCLVRPTQPLPILHGPSYTDPSVIPRLPQLTSEVLDGDRTLLIQLSNINMDQLLNQLIDDAIQRFGPRHRQELIIRHVIIEGDNFPETVLDETQKSITVRVTNSAKNSPEEAKYELGHEAIHCLLATGRRDTLYFEEGLASHYALTLSGIPRVWRRRAKAVLPKLLSAPYEAFRALRSTDEEIKALRKELPDIDQLKPALIEKHFGVSRRHAEAVCQRMGLNRPERM